MTSLTVYLSNVATSTLSTAAALSSATGGTLAGDSSLLGLATGYGEVYGLGNAGAWAAAGSIGSPSGNGWLWDVTTLEQQTIASGTWTPSIRVRVSNGTATADFHVRYYKRSSSGVYTQIGSDIVASAVALTTAYQVPTISASLPAMAFRTGDKLYADVWPNVTSNSTGSSAAVLFITVTTSATQGDATGAQVTPGYSVSPVALGVTFASVTHFNPSLTVKIALPTVTFASKSTFKPGLSVNAKLAVTVASKSTFSPTLSVKVPLAVTVASKSTFSPALIGGIKVIALSVTFAGKSTFTPTLTGGVLSLVRVTNGNIIYATDVSQIVKILQRPSGSIELGKY